MSSHHSKFFICVSRSYNVSPKCCCSLTGLLSLVIAIGLYITTSYHFPCWVSYPYNQHDKQVMPITLTRHLWLAFSYKGVVNDYGLGDRLKYFSMVSKICSPSPTCKHIMLPSLKCMKNVYGPLLHSFTIVMTRIGFHRLYKPSNIWQAT